MATAIPTHATGDVLTAADWNTVQQLNNNVGVYAANGAAVGSLPALTAPNFLIQTGNAVSVTFSSGTGTLTFPTAFPNGVLTVIATAGDSGGAFVINKNSAVGATPSVTSWPLVAYTAGNSAVNTTIYISFIAIGF